MPSDLSTIADASFLADPGQVADWRAVVLLEVATVTGLLGALPGSPDEVAGRTGNDPRATRIILDALAVYGVVACDGDDGFVLGPAAPDHGEAAVLHQHAGVVMRWATSLLERVRGGAPPVGDVWHLKELDRWLASLGTRARQRAPALVDACLEAVPGVSSVLDLGGGHGEYALEFARRGLEVTMQDRSAVVELARERGVLEAAGVRLFAGDFFETIAEGPFDLVLLAGVAHTYPEPDIRRLYERLRPAVGRALAISTFLRGADERARLFAVQMLSLGNGADTHARDEHETWLGDAGFADVRHVPVSVDATELLIAFQRRAREHR